MTAHMSKKRIAKLATQISIQPPQEWPAFLNVLAAGIHDESATAKDEVERVARRALAKDLVAIAQKFQYLEAD